MLSRGHESGVQKKTEPVGHIPTIGEDVNTARGLGENLGYRHDFRTLGGLPLSTHRSSET